MPGPPVSRIIAQEELRARFNGGGYWERAQRGELREELIREGHPSPPLANEPECTRSQRIAYISPGGVIVADVHQYLRPDGTLGLSGRPDPKGLLDRGVWYTLDLI